MFGSQDSTIFESAARPAGPSLARGPAWIVGLVLAAFGLAMFFRSPGTPLSTAGFADGGANGDTFLGIETNAWTAWGTTAAGLMVLAGAAQHVLAKTMSMLAGAALGTAAVLAIIDGDVLGLAAANEWTIVGWGAASAVLLVTALLPRIAARGHRERDLIAEGGIARQPGGEPAEAAMAQSSGGSLVAPAVTTGNATSSPAVAPREARSEPLRRTYRETPGTVTGDELAAARRAHAEESARRK